MTPKQFFDWQTSGGTDDVMRMVEAHPDLWRSLPDELKGHIEAPPTP
ncbi:MAG: hypothetical protein KAJ78_04735 [Acidobacteria bacterium]|nr:hypothetical protein [Acidobacteriota bacterium]